MKTERTNGKHIRNKPRGSHTVRATVFHTRESCMLLSSATTKASRDGTDIPPVRTSHLSGENPNIGLLKTFKASQGEASGDDDDDDDDAAEQRSSGGRSHSPSSNACSLSRHDSSATGGVC